MTGERRAVAGRSRRPTIRDVAAAAGVSRSTVSRALTGRGYTAGDVRERVLQAAAALGYVPDAMARTLKQQVSGSVGVLVSDLRNPFYAELAAGASREARERGYTLVLADTGLSAEAEREAAEALVALRVAGVVVTPGSPAVSTYLAAHHVPVVEVDRQFAAGSTDGVVVGNRAGARAATEHLVELGHRRIALFIDETDWTTGHERHHNLGATAVRRLAERVELPEADPVTTVLDVRLVTRESTAPPPAR